MRGVMYVYCTNPEARKASVQFINGRTEQLLYFTVVLNILPECGP